MEFEPAKESIIKVIHIEIGRNPRR